MATTTTTAPITFAVPGTPGDPAASSLRGAAAAPPAPSPFAIKSSVRVALQRDGGAPVAAEAVPGEDIVAVHIENGPVLYLHPETARDLMQGGADASAAARGGGSAVAVPQQLQWPGLDAQAATRDIADVGRVLVSGLQVLGGLLKGPVADWAASAVVAKVDGQVDAGVYPLRPDRLDALKGSGSKLARVPAASEPMLVLLHGTFVETVSTFGKLWTEHPGDVQRLFAQYGGRVYALDHPTLGASPIANARTLVDALPDGARLHLVTHSRGGLVAEVLARVAGSGGQLTAADLAHFSDPAYAGQRQELQALADAVRARHLQVERVVRVACPARGTLLASKRLDAYLSVLQWTLQTAGVPVAPAFVEFLGAVAQRRADPAQIPGLAAMIPDTPLVNWLNDAPRAIPGDLRVVAGDLQHGSTLTSWLKALLADAYYWTDNDIVVQTRSMYGGAPRSGGCSFLLDQGSGVTHFDYFRNDRTASAVVNALVQTALPAGFAPIGHLSWSGLSASGDRGAGAAQRGAFDEARPSTPDAGKPAVFVLPGILGSNLKQGPADRADRIWLGVRLVGGFGRLGYQPDGADSVRDDGPIGMVYSDLAAFLDRTHEVIPFGYDWRRPLQEEARRLAREVTLALDARVATGQPVRILAHSMGGLLARTMQLEAPDTWARLMQHPQARFVMLGTPNGGSWAPMQVLSGDDTFGNALASIGSPFANAQARALMAQMPGFLQLQAGLLDPTLKLAQADTWQRLADDDYQREQQRSWWHRYAGALGSSAYRWGVPPQAVLDQARALRERLDAQLAGPFKDHADQVLLVVGHAKTTPVGFEIGDEGFVYLEAPDLGDGRVPLQSALLPGVRTWTLDCAHGGLPSAKRAFDAYLDLLVRGSTERLDLLSAAPASTRGGGAPQPLLRSRPSRRPATARPAGDILELFSGATDDADGSLGEDSVLPPLQISVLNGNLTFVQLPLLVGHYRALELTGTEAVVDRHLGGVMSTALRAGLYPEATGSNRIFFNLRPDSANPWQLPRPQAAIVVGLGEEGVLTATQLEHSICQAVKAWSQRSREEAPERPGGIEIASTLIGSGGLGITPGAAARAIAQGVRQANRRLRGSGWPLVTRVTLVEWYLDRASDAWRGLQVLAVAAPKAFEVAPSIASGTGPLRRQPDSGYRGADYDLISTTADSDGTISFALDTRRARTEVRAQRTQPKLVRMLVQRAATAQTSDPDLGRTLFQLLVPLELKPFLAGNDRLVMQLDSNTASIPWELLDSTPGEGGEAAEDASSSDEPWSIRTRLLRKLATSDFRSNPRDARVEAAVLVIGAPKTDDPAYPELDGARQEAVAVAEQLRGPGGINPDRVFELTDHPEFDDVIVNLMARPYRVVHVAGHGAPIQRDPARPERILNRGGVVLSKDVFLGPDEIEKLPEVPELVFVNCCHLGAFAAAPLPQDAPPGTKPPERPQPAAFAAGVAESLIEIGVRCVVAAGWAVNDAVAAVFAQAFYATLLQGRPFVEAVVQARRAARARAPQDKTWAAYQCYGDPNWVLRPTPRGTGAGSAAGATPVRNEFEGIASAPGLALVLETLAVRARFETHADEAQALERRTELRRRIQGHEDRYAEQWGGIGAIAEAFGVAWDAADDIDKAIAWYQRALRCNDASASIKAQEQFGNLRARRAWNAAQSAAPGSPALKQGRQAIEAALQDLQALAQLQPTVERLALSGSALKRLAQLHQRDGNAAAARRALQDAAAAYTQAENLAAEDGGSLLFYPGLNRLALQLVLHAGEPDWRPDADSTARLRRSLQARHDVTPDFWTNAGLLELDLYQALAEHALDATRSGHLASGYALLHARVPARENWRIVQDQIGFVLGSRATPGQADEPAAAQVLLRKLARYVDAADASH